MNKTLDAYREIVIHYKIHLWNVEPDYSRFKAEVCFIDRSTLFVKDYTLPTGRKYAFHWQDNKGNLIARWDNAPHWKEIRTFPHHRHQKDSVFPSEELTLDEVMEHISIRLK